ncbi:hypothetical protein B0I35DRAFT_449923 [Stachybotrys elegans]|uniref:FAD-binding PCMH-type domain-containing protein n=1 Tax=Stachybotrys elegans TaxID=80388 RepID=A0A8K0SR46_9HYPO|nr:hypothetical protein B0I35DRAFT_449923 [Stachybotrys elegans]
MEPSGATASVFACNKLRSAIGDMIKLPSDEQYVSLSQGNWSPTTWKRPSCIAVPETSEQMATIVKIAVQAKAPFAIRSGGHSPNPGDANIDNGILISTTNLSQIDFEDRTKVVSVGPGAIWGDVYTALEAFNMSMVGGRVPSVGVGGLTLGGGLSYLSDQWGMVCDNVLAYEVVLSNGTIVEATATEHSDLFWALKGGSSNFGIVTRFDFTTVPLGQVWGGMQLYTGSEVPKLLAALNEYQSNPNKDLDANLIINTVPGTNDSALLTMVYLRPVERPAAFAPFYKLAPALEQIGLMTLPQLMNLFPGDALPRWAWYVTSFTPSDEAYARIHELLSSGPEVDVIKNITGGSLIGVVEPISASVALAGQARGGNALGLQAVNQTWMEVAVAWWDEADDDVANDALASIFEKVEAVTTELGIALEYKFMNDAHKSQAIIESYGDANVQRLRSIRDAYDPKHIFQSLLPGGQKIPSPQSAPPNCD